MQSIRQTFKSNNAILGVHVECSLLVGIESDSVSVHQVIKIKCIGNEIRIEMTAVLRLSSVLNYSVVG